MSLQVQAFAQRLRELRTHYTDRDYDLAHRRLLDAAIETGDTIIFRDVLRYEDWRDRADEEKATDAAVDKAFHLIDRIEDAGVAAVAADATDAILEVKNLGKRYATGKFALRDVSFSLQGGGIIGLVGENGNGKTTLLRLLATELKADSGAISYPFVQNEGDDYDIRTDLVYIEQRIPRWWGSLLDNLLFTVAHYGLYGETAELWVQMMIARLGLRPYRELSWNRLSSGYRTRFELAKTLLRKPRLLLLDEPLANLDILSQQTILQDLKFMAHSLTAPFGMMLSSQHIYEVEKVSDAIIFLKDGIPRYGGGSQAQIKETDTAPGIIYELETTSARDAVEAAFSTLRLHSLTFNGGVYIARFEADATQKSVLTALAESGLPVQYLRNITASSRRFFLS